MLTWKPQGDANEYFIMDGDRWLAGVQLNGEMLTPVQDQLMQRMVNSFNVCAEVDIKTLERMIIEPCVVVLSAEFDELLHLLTLALPYVETAADDPGYKSGPVRDLVTKMRAAIEAQGGVS